MLGIKETNGDLEALSKYLDVAGSKLDYRRYGEPLCDILIAGGLLAPGGTLITDGPLLPDAKLTTTSTTTEVCVFGRPSDDESIRAFTQVRKRTLLGNSTFTNHVQSFSPPPSFSIQVFVRLIRRYKYLEKSLEEDLKKIVVFLRAFTPDDRLKLAKVFAYLLASGHITVSPLKTLLERDELVKEGLAFQFLLDCLAAWQSEKDAPNVWASLRKSSLDSKLLEFLPLSKRNQESFSGSMLDSGLGQLLDYQKTQRVETVKRELAAEINNQIQSNETTPTELIVLVRDYMTENGFSDAEVVIILWNTLISLVEWSKKEELVADQAVKHMRYYLPLFKEFCKSQRAELALLVRIQDYCYENMNFLKAFQKLVLLFYKSKWWWW